VPPPKEDLFKAIRQGAERALAETKAALHLAVLRAPNVQFACPLFDQIEKQLKAGLDYVKGIFAGSTKCPCKTEPFFEGAQKELREALECFRGWAEGVGSTLVGIYVNEARLPGAGK
jgi:hypothetical protein